MRLNEVDAILDPAPLPLETGYERFADGTVHVACRTDLHGCRGEMFEWWFRSRPDTERYIWWHPVDHLESRWIEGTEGTHVGSIHLAKEYFTGLPSQELSIQFRHSEEFFTPDKYRAARADGRLSASVCARISAGYEPPRDDQGRVIGGRLLHNGRDTPWGCALRSHFYLGTDLPSLGLSPTEVEAIFPDEFAVALLQHCYNEFTYLSRFLPSIYIAAHRDTQPITRLPW